MFKFLKKIKDGVLPPSKKSIYKRLNWLSAKLDWMAERQELLFWFLQMNPGESMQQAKLRFYNNLGKEYGHFRNVQLIILSIMDFFNDVCEKNNLKYFLWSGTLLGAVRHKGFIPWDEDADVGMTRDDFNKFKKIIENHPRYKLVDFYEAGIRHHSCGRFSKLIDTKCPYQIYLDVFPFDYENVKDHDEAAAIYYSKRKKLEKEIWKKAKQLGVKQESRPIKDEYKKAELDKIFDKYVPLKQEGSSLQWGLDLFRAPYIRRWLVTGGGLLTAPIIFEGRKFYAQENYLEVLKLSFGDWTKLPPDAYSHFHSEYFDFDDNDEELEQYVKNEGLDKWEK